MTRLELTLLVLVILEAIPSLYFLALILSMAGFRDRGEPVDEYLVTGI